MIRLLHILALGALFLAGIASAQTVVAVNPVRAQNVITAADIDIVETDIPGAVQDPAAAIGQEARINLYPGRPIRLSDIGPPAILERNQLVVMIYDIGALTITVEGRALDRAGIGERVRVMNLDSRTTVTGIVKSDGTVEVRP